MKKFFNFLKELVIARKIFLISFFLFALLSLTNWFDKAKIFTLDMLFQMRNTFAYYLNIEPVSPGAKIYIGSLDDDSIDKIGQIIVERKKMQVLEKYKKCSDKEKLREKLFKIDSWEPKLSEWPRDIHARLVENLIKNGVKLIGFDLIFATTAENDEVFANTLKKYAGHVVLAAYKEVKVERDTYKKIEAAQLPLDIFWAWDDEDNQSLEVGFINVFTESGKFIRRYINFFKVSGDIFPSFALNLAVSYLEFYPAFTDKLMELADKEATLGEVERAFNSTNYPLKKIPYVFRINYKGKRYEKRTVLKFIGKNTTKYVTLLKKTNESYPYIPVYDIYANNFKNPTLTLLPSHSILKENININLKEVREFCGTINGLVLKVDGTPLQHALVIGESRKSHARFVCFSNEKGKFQLKVPEKEEYFLTVLKFKNNKVEFVGRLEEPKIYPVSTLKNQDKLTLIVFKVPLNLCDFSDKKEKKHKLQIKVVDKERKKVKGAEILIRRFGQTSEYKKISDENGLCVFELLEGRYVIQISYQGNSILLTSNLEKMQDRDLDAVFDFRRSLNVKVVLQEKGLINIKGTVKLFNNSLLKNAEVIAYRAEGEGPGRHAIFTRTDKAGNFRIEGLLDYNYKLFVYLKTRNELFYGGLLKEPYHRKYRFFTGFGIIDTKVVQGTSNLILYAVKNHVKRKFGNLRGSISGRVLLNGKPAKNIKVYALSIDEVYSSICLHDTKTDKHGKYKFANLILGNYVVFTELVKKNNTLFYGDTYNFEDKYDLKDAIVLIGSTSPQDQDFYGTPFDVLKGGSQTAGVDIHANALSTLLSQNFITPVSRVLYWPLLIFVNLLLEMWLSRSNLLEGILITIFVLLMSVLLTLIVFTFAHMWIDLFSILVLLAIIFVTTYVVRFILEQKEKYRIKKIFSRFVSPDYVNMIVNSKEEIKLGGVLKVLTVYFSDVAGFTTISEQLKDRPHELVTILNEYMDAMTKIIFKYNGTLDKYIGDAIMAFWGAPLPTDDPEKKACWAALDMRTKMLEIQKDLLRRGYPKLHCRAGINTGPMVVGNVGSEMRTDYTVLGDAVNLGARLEPANKPFNTDIMISETTYQAAKEHIIVRPLDILVVKGKTEPVRTYELIAKSIDKLPDYMLELIELYKQAYNSYYPERDFKKALKLFEKCLKVLPDDGPSLFYIKKCQDFLKNPPPPTWKGENVLKTK